LLAIEEIFPAIYEFIIEIIQNPIFMKYGLAGLFVNGLLSATILPIPTEITTTALIASGYDKLPVLTVLAASTIAGGFVSYYLGISGKNLFRSLKHKPKDEQQQEVLDNPESKSNRLLSRYGWIAILISAWIPAVGDLVPVIAGMRRYNLTKFAIALVVGKATKAVALVYLSSFLSSIIFDAS